MLRASRLFAGLRRIGPVQVDALVGLVLLVVIELQLWSGSSSAGVLPAIGGVVFSGAVAVRRRWPLAGILVILGVLAVKTALSSPQGGLKNSVGVLPALILLFYGLGAFAPERRSRWVFALAVVVSSINTLTTPGKGASALLSSEVFVALVPYGLGRMMRARVARGRVYREQAERLDAGREVHARTAASEERARIARELHDVIAHSVSVMVIQAGGARLVMSSDPDRAEASLRSVGRAGREALAEMRRLVSLLDGEADARGRTPQPGLADLEDLLSDARSAGLPTDLLVDGEPAIVSPALDLCAYRIVQEALTNAIRHAGPAHAYVRVRWAQGALELEISDDGLGPGTVNSGSGGHGIAGMRERVALHGGSVHSGAGACGGFTVRATLPLVKESV